MFLSVLAGKLPTITNYAFSILIGSERNFQQKNALIGRERNSPLFSGSSSESYKSEIKPSLL